MHMIYMNEIGNMDKRQVLGQGYEITENVVYMEHLMEQI